MMRTCKSGHGVIRYYSGKDCPICHLRKASYEEIDRLRAIVVSLERVVARLQQDLVHCMEEPHENL